ncbi:sugar-binding transcriptional regulator [Agrococcus sp. SGAir0287]|uniref:sugar-binding transcriptional regulator n=1 Tax=Agrococcus sp. SGAir0287 TaxID=2070347 RepID=UPI0010CCB1EC|nr:sugar-binding domain-containing protein [Agrococcus sp. SGAir0287]QCR18191.1 transcriptional regulator [Agrococcus sp. SGAir0287]
MPNPAVEPTLGDDARLERELAIRAARRFYLDDRSKVEIAQELGVSRFKVARLLELARETGIVRIAIDDEGFVDDERAERLRELLGLGRAVVVSTHGGGDDARRIVGAAAARLLTDSLEDGEVLGMGWGRTLAATAVAIERLPRVSVVQMTGATEASRDLSPVEIVRRIGLRSGGEVVPVFAPLVADDAETARAFRRQSDIARALAMHDRVTTAVMSIGGWDSRASQLCANLDPAFRDDLLARGVVAEIGITLVDATGAEIAPDFAERGVAVTSQQLRAIPRVIGVAAGAEKAVATVALARAGLVTELVVDVALADAAIEHAGRAA